MSIVDKMTKAPYRETVIKDCVGLIDNEVKDKGGLSGIAIKAAYGVVKAVKPGFVAEVVDGLLDEWTRKLEPFYQAWQGAGSTGTFGDYVSDGRSDAVANALLEVTDKKAANSKNGTVRKMYEKMRGSAKENVVKALPRLGTVVEKAGKST